MNSKMPEIAGELIKEYERLFQLRGTFESQYKEVADRVYPSHSVYFQSQGQITPGEKRTNLMYDATAAMALNRFAAILDSLLTPRNQTWHRLVASDPYLNKDREVKLWFEEATRLLFKYRYAPKANFSSQNQLNYKSLGAFGTGCLYVDELANEPGLRYRAVHLGEIFFMENHQGLVDRALRYFRLTARQARQQFGEENLPDLIKSALKNNPDAEYPFIHCVKPREDIDQFRKDYKGMAFASYYVSVEGQSVVQEGGYAVFPYAISRYEQAPGEVYGRSPAMEVLPAIKTLNEEKKTILKQGQRATDPVLFVHDDGVLDAVSLKPGAINSGGVNADGRLMVHALPTGNISIGKDLMDDERLVINDAFLVNLFQILTETPQMTATEVLERSREKGMLLAPTVGRQQSEYLGPMIERELDILARQRLLPPMPGILLEAKGEYNVMYDSPLSRSQRAEEAAGLMRTVESALNVVNVTQNMEPLDHFDWDAIIPELSEINAVPARWMKSPEMVAQIRQGRQEAAQQQQLVQAAPGAAALIKADAVSRKA